MECGKLACPERSRRAHAFLTTEATGRFGLLPLVDGERRSPPAAGRARHTLAQRVSAGHVVHESRAPDVRHIVCLSALRFERSAGVFSSP